MDADDVSLPERFSSQVAYLDEHPEVGILGTKVVYIDGDGRGRTAPGKYRRFRERWAGSSSSARCLAHPSVMMRRELVLELGSYDGEAQHAEDYDLWARAASMTKLANLESPQVQRRGWEGSVTQRYPEIQEETVRRVLRSLIERQLDLTVSADDVVSLRLFATEQIAGDLNRIKQVASLLPRMHHAYVARASLSDEEKRIVGLDAARKLYALAHEVRPLSRRASVSIALRGARLDPRPLRAHSREGLRKTIL